MIHEALFLLFLVKGKRFPLYCSSAFVLVLRGMASTA